MTRDIPVGNGSMLVNFDEDYRLRDLFFPCVGKENQTDGHPCRFGVWVDGRFSWVDREWHLRFEYAGNSLVTRVTASNDALGVALVCNDLVDREEDMYIKKVLVRNLADREREFRLFFHHDFNILESSAANTAYYDPDEKALIHYKEKRYFLMSGMRNGVQGIDQYATGVKEFRGLEGTWKDAEDGLLGGNPIAQGSVDSTLGFTVNIPAQGGGTVNYWICAGEDYGEVSRLNKMIRGHGLEHFTRRTSNYWKAWGDKAEPDFGSLSPAVRRRYRQSLLILRTNIDAGGAILAGTDSDIAHTFARDTYGYMWPRDGAFAAYALDAAGYPDITWRFFDFCGEIVRKGKESRGGYFLHKYNPDGSLGSSWQPWVSGGRKILPIQEDSTALILWSLWEHYRRYRNIESVAALYERLIVRCGDFLASYRDDDTGLPLPSYDLWEEKWGIHTFTVSAVYGGIRAAESFAGVFGDARRERLYGRAATGVQEAMGRYLYDRREGRFLKTILPAGNGSFERDLTVDASTYAAFYFNVFAPDDERVTGTMRAIIDRLSIRTGVGGIARYEGDAYYRNAPDAAGVPGNSWFICTLWLAQWAIAKAKHAEDLREAERILEWASDRAVPSGVLAEQLDPRTGRSLSVAPLTWSQGAFVAAVREYGKKAAMLEQKEKKLTHLGAG